MIKVIGSINLDLTATVGRLPRPGETVPGDGFSTAPGGKGANQALAARRAGSKVKMIGAVGTDAFAEQATALLKHGGVDLDAVRASGDATGIAVILVEKAGENVIAIIPGGNAAVSHEDVADAAVAQGDHVVLQLEIPMETVRASLEASRAAGAVSLLNTAPFRQEAAEFLELADYAIANETEFDLYAETLALTGDNREDRIRDCAARTGRTIVVTLGADGVVAASTSEFYRAKGLKITPVDTVGAGDTFCGYFAASLGAGHDLPTALRRAAVAGSLACLKPGAQPSIPRAAEVDAALAAN